MATFTSNSEFTNEKRVQLTNETPPFDVYDSLNSVLQNELWQWILGYSKIKYNLPYATIAPDGTIIRDVDSGDVYHKFVNGEESENYGPIVDVSNIEKGGSIPRYHTMEIDGVILPEFDLLIHEVYRYLGSLYPDHTDYNKLLTQNEINDIFSSAGKMLDYDINTLFLDEIAGTVCSNTEDIQDEALMLKIRNLRNNAFRRRFYGSRAGYRMFTNDIYKNVSVFPVGTYLPVEDVSDDILTTKVKSFDRNYRRKFRLIDWSGHSSSSVKESLDYTEVSLVSLPFENEIMYYYPALTSTPFKSVSAGDYVEIINDTTSSSSQVESIGKDNYFADEGIYYSIRTTSGLPTNALQCRVSTLEGISFTGSTSARSFDAAISAKPETEETSVVADFKNNTIIPSAKDIQKYYEEGLDPKTVYCFGDIDSYFAINAQDFYNGYIEINSQSNFIIEQYRTLKNTSSIDMQFGRDFVDGEWKETGRVLMTFKGKGGSDEEGTDYDTVTLSGYAVITGKKSGVFSCLTDTIRFTVLGIEYGSIYNKPFNTENISLLSEITEIKYVPNDETEEAIDLTPLITDKSTITKINLGYLKGYCIFNDGFLNTDVYTNSFFIESSNGIYISTKEPEPVTVEALHVSALPSEKISEYVFNDWVLYKWDNYNERYVQSQADIFVSSGQYYSYKGYLEKVEKPGKTVDYVSECNLVCTGDDFNSYSGTSVGSVTYKGETVTDVYITSSSEQKIATFVFTHITDALFNDISGECLDLSKFSVSIGSEVYSVSSVTSYNITIKRFSNLLDTNMIDIINKKGIVSHTISYLSYYTKVKIESTIDIEKSANTIYFETEDARDKMLTLSVGDIVYGPSSNSSEDTFITSVGYNEVTVNNAFTNSGRFNLTYLVRVSTKPESTSDDVFLYKKQLSNNSSTKTVFNTGCFGSSSWPNAGASTLIGYSDRNMIDIYDEPQTDISTLYSISDFKPFDYVCEKLGVTTPSVIKYENDLFVELMADKTINIATKSGVSECLMSVDYLDYLQDNINALSRATDVPNVGVNLTMNTDVSGLYYPGSESDATYTDYKTKVKFRVVPGFWKAEYEGNTPEYAVPYYAQIGNGTSAYVDSKLSIELTSSALVSNAFEGAYFSEGGSATPQQHLYVNQSETGTISVKGAEIDSISSPLFEIPLGEYDTQVCYKPEDNKYRFTTVSATFYKETFNNIKMFFNKNDAVVKCISDNVKDYKFVKRTIQTVGAGTPETFTFVEPEDFDSSSKTCYTYNDIVSLNGGMKFKSARGSDTYISQYAGFLISASYNNLFDRIKDFVYDIKKPKGGEVDREQLLKDTIYNVTLSNGDVVNYMLYFIIDAEAQIEKPIPADTAIGIIYHKDHFDIIELNRDSYITRILPFNNSFSGVTHYMKPNKPLYAPLKDVLTSYTLPRKYFTPGAFDFSLLIDPRFKAKGYRYTSDNKVDTSTEVDFNITKGNILYDKDNDVFYCNSLVYSNGSWSDSEEKIAIKFNEIKYWKNLLTGVGAYRSKQNIVDALSVTNRYIEPTESMSMKNLSVGDELHAWKEVYPRRSAEQVSKTLGFYKAGNVTLPIAGIKVNNSKSVDVMLGAKYGTSEIIESIENLKPKGNNNVTSYSPTTGIVSSVAEENRPNCKFNVSSSAQIGEPVLPAGVPAVDFRYFKTNLVTYGTWDGECVTLPSTDLNKKIKGGDSVKAIYYEYGSTIPSEAKSCLSNMKNVVYLSDVKKFVYTRGNNVCFNTSLDGVSTEAATQTIDGVITIKNVDNTAYLWTSNGVSKVDVSGEKPTIISKYSGSSVVAGGVWTEKNVSYPVTATSNSIIVHKDTNVVISDISGVVGLFSINNSNFAVCDNGVIYKAVPNASSYTLTDVIGIQKLRNGIYSDTYNGNNITLFKVSDIFESGYSDKSMLIGGYVPRRTEIEEDYPGLLSETNPHDGLYSPASLTRDLMTPVLFRFDGSSAEYIDIGENKHTGKVMNITQADGSIYFAIGDATPSQYFILRTCSSTKADSVNYDTIIAPLQYSLTSGNSHINYSGECSIPNSGESYYESHFGNSFAEVNELIHSVEEEVNVIKLYFNNTNFIKNSLLGEKVILSIKTNRYSISNTECLAGLSGTSYSTYASGYYKEVSEVDSPEVCNFIYIKETSYPSFRDAPSLYKEEASSELGEYTNSFGLPIYATDTIDITNIASTVFAQSYTPKFTVEQLFTEILFSSSSKTISIKKIDWTNDIVYSNLSFSTSHPFTPFMNWQKYQIIDYLENTRGIDESEILNADGTIKQTINGGDVQFTTTNTSEVYTLSVKVGTDSYFIPASDVHIGFGYETDWITSQSESNIEIEDLKNISNVSDIYIPAKGYGSLAQIEIDSTHLPWDIDKEAFEQTNAYSERKDISGLTNVYLCDVYGERVYNTNGEPIVVKGFTYSNYQELLTALGSYSDTDEYKECNVSLSEVDTTYSTLSDTNEFSSIDDGKIHYLKLKLLTAKTIDTFDENYEEVSPDDFTKWTPDRAFISENSFPATPFNTPSKTYNANNMSYYTKSSFTNKNGKPIKVCNSDGVAIYYSSIEDGSSGSITSDDGQETMYIHVDDTYENLTEMYTPVYTSCKNWFKYEYYIEGEEANPFWQNLHIYSTFYNGQWIQKTDICEYKNLNNGIVTSPVPENEQYIKIQKGTDYVRHGTLVSIYLNRDFIDTAEGTIQFIEEPPAEMYKNNVFIKKFGITAENSFCNGSGEYSGVWNTNNCKFDSTLISSYTLNSTENKANSLDINAGITEITEFGLFNKEHQLIAYASFPPIEYRTDKQHISFTAIVTEYDSNK